MFRIILLIVLVVVVVVALPVAGFIAYVKSKDRKKGPRPAIGSDTIAASTVNTCSGCGEKRIIVNQDDTLCAACYSALRTKKLG